ncbi:hypothetical protein T4D_2732 [Trichinella pseudospiralis]|uniref:Uncharacterized protein n=1 Tax=Trichinella pseudospiralis TaxID=6337 RepID=A0A0V1FFY2_TRIPS|nr:hypothetical protein T4D_2732 [Trichinella pseudospiralis]
MKQKTKSSFTAQRARFLLQNNEILISLPHGCSTFQNFNERAARVINGGKRVSLANVHYQVRICLRTLVIIKIVLFGWIPVAFFSHGLLVGTNHISRRSKLNPSASRDDDMPAFHCQRCYEILYYEVEFVIGNKVFIWYAKERVVICLVSRVLSVTINSGFNCGVDFFCTVVPEHLQYVRFVNVEFSQILVASIHTLR